MPRHRRRVFSCGLVMVATILISASFLEPLPVNEVSAGSVQGLPLDAAEFSHLEASRMHRPAEVRATEVMVISPLGSPSEGADPTPSDPPFDPNVRVWGDTNEQLKPTMVVSPANGYIHVAFQHFNGNDWDIYVTQCAGVGSPWSTPVPLWNTTANEENPSMAVTSTGILGLVFTRDSDSGNLYLAQSTDGGTRWGLFTLLLSTWWSDAFTDIQFPKITAQTTVGKYPNGIALVFQALCVETTNCNPNAHVIPWMGMSDFSQSSVTFDLGGYFYWPWIDRKGDQNIFVDSMRPSVAWSDQGWDVGFDDEWYVPDAEWRLTWVVFPEDGSPPPFAYMVSRDVSQAGIYSHFARSGRNSMIVGTFLNASAFPLNPGNHNVGEFHTTDSWVTAGGNVPFDTDTTDQRSVSLAGENDTTKTFHLTYYSDAVVTDWWTDDVGSTWNGPNKVSDNNGTGVNADQSTSVAIDEYGAPYVAWQDNRDGDTNVYASVGVGSQGGKDTTGPRTRNPMAIPNPYVENYSTSLEIVATIDDSLSGSSNITAAQLVITNQSISRPSVVDWTNAWKMNLTGVNRSKTETAWLWANSTAASWRAGSCHRFWVRGQDSEGNWGKGSYVDVCVVVSKTPRPPKMTKAELVGSNFRDVALTWERSPDDGGGTYGVILYKILRSDAIGGPFSVVGTVTATKIQSYSWTDSGAGHGNSRNFFYCVVANSSSYDSPPSRLAAKFYRTMDGGKQLLSFPLEQSNYDITVVFQTFDYIYARTYVAGTPNPWWCHKPGRFINSLTQLSIMQGYWVELDGPGTMTIAGLVPVNASMSLKSGWNMIGFPSFGKSFTLADLDAAIGGMLQLVEIYDPAAGPYYLQTVHRNAWSRTYMTAGYAYMVRVSSDVNWLVPNN